jgi:hypothetical protein
VEPQSPLLAESINRKK